MKTVRVILPVLLLWSVLPKHAASQETGGSGDTSPEDGSASGIPDEDACSLTMVDDEDYSPVYAPIQLVLESQPTCDNWINDEHIKVPVRASIQARLIQTINSQFPQCNYTTAHWRNERITCNELQQSPIQIVYTANITQPVGNSPDELQQALSELNTDLGTVEGINLTNPGDEEPTLDTLTPDLSTQPTRESEGTSSGTNSEFSFYMLVSSILWYWCMI